MTSEWIDKWRGMKDNPQMLLHLFKTLKRKKLKSFRNQMESKHQEVFEKFDCLQCANCCKSIPPIVSSRDSKRIAQYLGISKASFRETYLRVDGDGYTVINASPCPFLEPDNRCRIYEVRPNACRQYPHSGDYQFIENLDLHQQNIKYCPALFKIVKDISELVGK